MGPNIRIILLLIVRKARAVFSLGLATSLCLQAASLSLHHEATVNYDFARVRVPVWSGGALVAFDANRTASPLLLGFNDQGERLSTVPFTIPDAELIDLYDISRAPSGTIAVCGRAYDHSGRGAGFFAIVESSTYQATVVRLYPYSPARITIGSDGTIWTTGIEVVNGKETDPGVNLNNGVLRHFDRSGKLLASLIPRSSLTSSFVAQYGFLRSANDRVGWYTGPVAGPGSEYYEVLSDGTVRKYAALALSAYEYVTGLALMEDGRTYVTTSDNKNRVWRLLSITPAGKGWTPERLPDQFERATLYGADGERLVFLPSSRFKITFMNVSR